MKHKHYTTPGDWRLTPDGERVESVSPELEGGIQPICDDIRHRGDGMKIAAVPSLIAALREASRALTELDPLAYHHDAKVIDEAMKAAGIQ